MICLLQAKVELQDANLKVMNTIAGMSSSAGGGWHQLKEAQDELQRQHGAAMGSIRGQEAREWCASFKAVGNMAAGNFEQVHTPPCCCYQFSWFCYLHVYDMVWQQDTGHSQRQDLLTLLIAFFASINSTTIHLLPKCDLPSLQRKGIPLTSGKLRTEHTS